MVIWLSSGTVLVPYLVQFGGTFCSCRLALGILA